MGRAAEARRQMVLSTGVDHLASKPASFTQLPSGLPLPKALAGCGPAAGCPPASCAGRLRTTLTHNCPAQHRAGRMLTCPIACSAPCPAPRSAAPHLHPSPPPLAPSCPLPPRFLSPLTSHLSPPPYHTPFLTHLTGIPALSPMAPTAPGPTAHPIMSAASSASASPPTSRASSLDLGGDSREGSRCGSGAGAGAAPKAQVALPGGPLGEDKVRRAGLQGSCRGGSCGRVEGTW